MRNLFVLTLLIVALSFTEPYAQPSHRDHTKLGCYHKSEWLDPRFDSHAQLRLEEDYNYDVEHYLIDIALNWNEGSVAGTVTMSGHSNIADLSDIDVNLRSNMNVEEVLMDDISLGFTHQSHILNIEFEEPLAEDESFEITIQYDGNPSSSGDYGMEFTTGWFGDPVIWTQDEPEGCQYWMPCHDVPDDKATVESRITIEDGWLVASNGLLEDIIDNGDGTNTHVWRTNYRMSTYLIAITASEYVTFSDWYHYSDTDSMEVLYYVYPEHLDEAEEDFNVTVPIIEAFVDLFGYEYPFIEEKYGMVEYPWGGAMENQTMTSYGEWLIRGDHRYDWINAHEIGHQWWGDHVGPMNWAEIWLNEGFASYSEALWYEYLYGWDELRNYVVDFQDTYITRHNPPHAIYDPPPGHLFCYAEYDKAATVVHMLRWIVGEENFFDIFPIYAETYAASNATTEDLRAVCEDVSGMDLEWFFQQWIYEYDYPQYTIAWAAEPSGDEYLVEVQIGQVQPEETVFEMPIEIEIFTDENSYVEIIDVDEAFDVFYFTIPEEPYMIIFDPNDWILCTIEPVLMKTDEDDSEINTPAQAILYQNVPNPFNPKTQIRFDLNETTQTSLKIYSITGQLVKTLVDEVLDGGQTYGFTWDGRNEQGEQVESGTYLYQLITGDQVKTKTMILMK